MEKGLLFGRQNLLQMGIPDMAGLDKKALSERDIRTKFIMPAVEQAGWDEMSQIQEQVHFTKGRIIVRGKLVALKRRRHATEKAKVKSLFP